MQIAFGRLISSSLGKIWVLLVAVHGTASCLAQSEPLKSAVCQAGSELGFVSNVHGNWIDKKHIRGTNQPLHISSLVCEDSELVRQPPTSDDDELSIRLRDGREKNYSCEKANLCSGPFRLPELPKPSSGFIEALLLLLSRQPPPRGELISRGGGLTDSVVMLQSGRISLGPALRYVSRGEYTVRLCQMDTKDSSQCMANVWEHHLEVNGTATEPIAAASLKPGLYQMELTNPSATDNQRSRSWILIASEKDFERLSSQYEEAKEESSAWEESSTDVSSLLRLYMLGLAERM